MSGDKDKANDVHVYPINDLFEHQLTRDCWCKPTVRQEPGADALVIHNSADEREKWEKAPIVG